MKTQQTLIKILSFTAALIPLANAASIGLNLVGSDITKGTLTTSTVAGLPAFQQSMWNNISAGGTYADTLGQSFVISLTGADAFSGSLGLNTTNGLHDANDQLMNGFLSGNLAADGKLDFTSIPSSYVATGYSVIVYLDGTSNSTQGVSLDAGRIGNFTSRRFYLTDTTTFNGSFSRATATSSAAPTSGANYVQFDNLTSSSFTLLFDAVGSSDRRYFNGVQVVQNIPEPTAAILCVLAFGANILRRKRA